MKGVNFTSFLALQCVRVSGGDKVTVRPFEPPATGFQAALVTAEVALLAQKRAAAAAAPLELDAPDLSAHLLTRFQGQVCHTAAVFSLRVLVPDTPAQ